MVSVVTTSRVEDVSRVVASGLLLGVVSVSPVVLVGSCTLVKIEGRVVVRAASLFNCEKWLVFDLRAPLFCGGLGIGVNF